MSKLLKDLSLDCRITLQNHTPENTGMNGKDEDQGYSLLNGKEKVEWQESSLSPSQSSQNSPVKQKPPAVSKKPQISFLPAFSPKPAYEQGQSHEDTTSLSQTEDEVDATQRKNTEVDTDTKNEENDEEETLETSRLIAVSGETSTANQSESQNFACASQENSLHYGLCSNGGAHEEEEDGDGTSSTTGSISSKEDDTGESGLHLFTMVLFYHALSQPKEMYRIFEEITLVLGSVSKNLYLLIITAVCCCPLCDQLLGSSKSNFAFQSKGSKLETTRFKKV